MKFKINFKIQSYSDIITNSSSELFAVIRDSDKLSEINNMLTDIFGWNQEYEVTICNEYLSRPSTEDINGWDWVSALKTDNKKPEDYPEEWIEIEMPYSLSDYKTFYKTGLEALLKEKFGNNFTIEYYDE